MNVDIPQHLMLQLARLTPAEQRKWLSQCLPADALLMDAAFEAWHAKGQLQPTNDGWRVWLMLAGRGFGKTRAGAEWVHQLAWSRPSRIALVAATVDEARRIMVEGPSGILSVARRKRHHIKWEPSLGRLTWPRGTVAELFSGDNADGLRGPEHDFAWCDELAKWRQCEAAWNNLFMGLRRGPRPRALITTTPRPSSLLEKLKDHPRTIVTGSRTKQNINLPREFVDAMVETYGGTRLGRQELDGELITDIEGALWTREMIAAARARPLSPEPSPMGGRGEFDRVVVGVDPPASAGEQCDACGIVVAAKKDGLLYVLEDASVAGLSPEGWANRVAAAAARWGAALIVAEANNGGAMVKSVLDAAEAGVRIKLVHASKGKVARAEPIALRFEKGKVRLSGVFPDLENELCSFVAGVGYEGPGSPDRADAMVWALTELSETKSGLPRIVRL